MNSRGVSSPTSTRRASSDLTVKFLRPVIVDTGKALVKGRRTALARAKPVVDELGRAVTLEVFDVVADADGIGRPERASLCHGPGWMGILLRTC